MQKKSKGRILSITRICGYCGNPFEAHNSTTRFCSRKCYNRDYYLHHAQIMNLKRAELYKKTYKPRNPAKPNPLPASGEITTPVDLISIKEAARRMCVCKQTVYNLIHANQIREIRYTSRLSYVKWSEIVNHFNHNNPKIPQITLPKGKQPLRREVIAKFEKATAKAKLKESTPLWLTPQQVCERYDLSSINIVYAYASKFHIVKKKVHRHTLYSSKAFDAVLEPYPDKTMPSWYITIKEASLRYNLSLTGVRKRLDILGVKYTWFQKSIIFQEDEFVKKSKRLEIA